MGNGEWSICGVCDGRCGFESVDDVGEPIWIVCFACEGSGQMWYEEDEELEVPESYVDDSDSE